MEPEIYKNYIIHIYQDETAPNPFEDWDSEMPLIAYYSRQFFRYNNAPTFEYLVRALPDYLFARTVRLQLLKDLLCMSTKEFAEKCVCSGNSFREQLVVELCKRFPEPKRSWVEATEYFDMIVTLTKLAKIPHYYNQSNGYSQGDCALVISFATPEWVEKVGAYKTNLRDQCRNAYDLFAAWLWGDVYRYTITDPFGNDVVNGSCWGFYGEDVEKSGLLPDARTAIDIFIKNEEKEKAYWATRDVETISTPNTN